MRECSTVVEAFPRTRTTTVSKKNTCMLSAVYIHRIKIVIGQIDLDHKNNVGGWLIVQI